MSHRKADVEMDDEDGFLDEVFEVNVQQLEQYNQQKIAQVRDLLYRNNLKDALQHVISDPVIGGNSLEPIKTQITQCVFEVLQQAKPNEIAQLVRNLRQGELDILLKVRYL